MRRLCPLVVCLFAFSTPTPSEAGGFELRLGGYFPRADTGADNDLFRDLGGVEDVGGAGGCPEVALCGLFGVRGSDWDTFTGGIELSVELGSFFEAGIRADWSSRTLQTSYLDFVDADGQEIRQTLRLNLVPVGATLRLIPTGPNRFAPYVAVGADLHYYRYEEFGDFVDFFDEDLPIVDDSFISDGTTFGWHVALGIRVPITYDISLTAEVKRQWAETEMNDDFFQNRLDLTGTSATLGFRVRF